MHIFLIMANNFFLSQDPLLFQNPYSRGLLSDDEARKQFQDTLNQYRDMQKRQIDMQSANNGRDYVGELETLMKSLNASVIEELSNNDEYNKLNTELTNMIQNELMANIKWRVNSNQEAIKNIEMQSEIIKKVNKRVEDEQRQSLNELNDYVKNYSNITFDEYKKIKNSNNNSVNKS